MCRSCADARLDRHVELTFLLDSRRHAAHTLMYAKVGDELMRAIEPMKACKLMGAYATVAGVPGALPLLHTPCGCQYYVRACLLLHHGLTQLS